MNSTAVRREGINPHNGMRLLASNFERSEESEDFGQEKSGAKKMRG